MNNILDKVDWRTFVNEKLSGRKVNRWTVNLLCAGLTFCFIWAAWRWANGAQLPPLPGETLFLAVLPYIQSMFDNFTRSNETRSAIHANHPSVNPHGGPEAP